MKKYLFLLVVLLFSITTFAQLEVKEGSFKEVPGFVNINTDKMYDDNEKPYAVLKVRTENLSSKQRRELTFKGDAQTYFEVDYQDGEVWLYISYYATFIKISHEELSSTEFYFPFNMKPKCGYELTLVNKTAPVDDQVETVENVLMANDIGVQAYNLHARTYLIIGNHSRMEDYGENRTGCFYISHAVFEDN